MRKILYEISKALVQIRDVISRRDLVPKFVSLLLAVLLWAYIGSTKLAVFEYRIPIEIKNLPPSLVVSKMNLTSITVRLNGKKEDFANFNIKNIRAVANLENAKVGTDQRFPIAIIKNELPESIRVTNSKNYVIVDIERRLTKKVPVEAIFSDNIKESLAIGNVAIIPPFVTISGSESIVGRVGVVYTEMISGFRDVGRFEREMPIDRTRIKEIELYPSSVRVQYSLLSVDGLQKIELPLIVKNLSEEFRVELSKRKVLVYVKTTFGQQVSPDDFEAYVDVNRVELQAGGNEKNAEYIMKVQVGTKNNKEGITMTVAIPSTIKLRVTKG
ncbi:MAG: hypothetical protein N2316_04200 [Spirochaetes bacterium]|nr:hypothetical protein [Spirochaetota bacterium]